MSTTTVSSAMISSGVIPAVHRNDIINGGYLVNQENDTAAADDDYSIGDLFLHVGEAAVTTSLQTSGGPQGDRNFARINIDTANKQSGWVYFLSNADCQDYIANGKMSFGIKIKTTSAAIDTVRIGLLKWTGTADSVTSDVVATWAQDGTNPTLATSWSYENTPADVNLTTDWVRHTVENVTVDSDTNNLACFVWIDDGTIAEDDQFDVTEWQLNPGSTVNAFSSPSLPTVIDQVYYYLQRVDLNNVSQEASGWAGYAYSTTAASMHCKFTKKLRKIPTMTSSAAGTFGANTVGSTPACTSIGFSLIGRDGTAIDIAVSSGFTAGRVVALIRDSSDTTFVMADARH